MRHIVHSRHALWVHQYHRPKICQKFKEDRKKKSALRSPYGDKHYFNQCEYINTAVLRKGFEENREIVNKVQDWFNDNKDIYEKKVLSLKKKNGIIADYLQYREVYSTSVSQAYGSYYAQYNSMVLDTATKNHVFHQRSQFLEYEELDKPIEVLPMIPIVL